MSTPPALYKTVVVIWTREHPEEQERDLVELAQAAIDGQAYCSRAQTTSIVDPSKDPDWDRTEFFDSGTISPETVPPFRTVTAATLSTAYRTLFPDECTYSQPQITNHEEIMSNWVGPLSGPPRIRPGHHQLGRQGHPGPLSRPPPSYATYQTGSSYRPTKNTDARKRTDNADHMKQT